MDKFRKALLGAASLLALTATGQKSADAAIPPADSADEVNKTAQSAGYPVYADPLFELMKQTNGSFGRQAIERALKQMFADPSPEQVKAMPMLVASLSELGAPLDVIARSREVLIDLVSNAPNISDDLMATALDELQQGQPGIFKLAAGDDRKRRRRRREPEEIGQVPGGGAAS